MGAARGRAEGGAGARHWARTPDTRQTLLRAAQEVFTERGFANATVTEIVTRADTSNGSLYHHFGGKSELFLALWEDYQRRQEQRAAAAVTGAREAGLRDPKGLFAAGTRGFLQGSWEDRELTRLFSESDGPPGFELLRRGRSRQWSRQNATLLQADDTPLNWVVVLILGTLIDGAGREVANCASEAEAHALIDDVVHYVQRLDVSPRPGSERS